jgi:hypothetical protein
MSLTITTPITTLEGFEVVNAYGRVTVSDSYPGTSLFSELVLFVSEEDFLEQKYALKVNINEFCSSEYNREVDGTDILLIAHQKLQESLLEQGITSVIVLGN